MVVGVPARLTCVAQTFPVSVICVPYCCGVVGIGDSIVLVGAGLMSNGAKGSEVDGRKFVSPRYFTRILEWVPTGQLGTARCGCNGHGRHTADVVNGYQRTELRSGIGKDRIASRNTVSAATAKW